MISLLAQFVSLPTCQNHILDLCFFQSTSHFIFCYSGGQLFTFISGEPHCLICHVSQLGLCDNNDNYRYLNIIAITIMADNIDTITMYISVFTEIL